MSTEKQKSKSTIIAITVLSVLLALAVTATIVLAAFQASREASTTITFGNGITLNVTGITDNSGTYAWDATVGSTPNTSGTVSNLNGDETVSLDEVKVTVSGTAAYVAVLATVTGTSAPTPKYASGWIDATGVTELTSATGWYVYGTGTTANTIAVDSETDVLNATTIFTAGTDDANDFASRSYTAEIKIAASDTLAELATLIASLS